MTKLRVRIETLGSPLSARLTVMVVTLQAAAIFARVIFLSLLFIDE
jgi:hypothetical protein